MDVYWTHQRYISNSFSDLNSALKHSQEMSARGISIAVGAVYDSIRNCVRYVTCTNYVDVFTTKKIAEKSHGGSIVFPITFIKASRNDRVHLYNSREFVKNVTV